MRRRRGAKARAAYPAVARVAAAPVVVAAPAPVVAVTAPTAAVVIAVAAAPAAAVVVAIPATARQPNQRDFLATLRGGLQIPAAAAAATAVAPATVSASTVVLARIVRPALHRESTAKLAAVEAVVLHLVACVLGIGLADEAHKGEATAVLGVVVPGDVHVANLAMPAG